MNIIDHSVTVLKSFEIEPKPIDRVLSAYLKKHKEISGANRRLLYETIFGVMRWLRRLDGYLELSGVRKSTWQNRILCYYLWKKPEGSEKLVLNATIEAMLSGIDYDSVGSNRFPGGEAAYYSLPDFLYRRIKKNRTEEYKGRLPSLNEPLMPVLRINKAQTDRDIIISELKDLGIQGLETTMSPFGIRLNKRVNLETVPSYKNGSIDIQDEASQLATFLAFSSEKQKVLDLCAGAGGKSLMLADLMNGQGQMFASDIDSKKLKKLYARAKRMKIDCIETISKDTLMDSNKLRGSFDVVLIDAPCTGTGTLRRNPDLKWRIDEKLISDRAEMQLEILNEGTQFVAEGGRVVYLTCSLFDEENDDVVKKFLERNGDFALEKPDQYFARYSVDSTDIIDGMYFRTNPVTYSWDGFFGASLIKK
ncbi:MAG: RsmB/NOP family class I SAM-dependent RNA methyltransferase [Deltaproteobacteria bacterium]|jgi:16S rRNA (cytosine967-C5)-methyltransferase|nr:RsmB/NOP family class I SAM-dependent RNA methyltransferase [Deltaproteobacteria bacterium]